MDFQNNDDLHSLMHLSQKEKNKRFYQATINNNTPLIFNLIKAGAQSNTIDLNGHSALHFAAHYGNNTAINFFLNEGLDLDLKDNEGCTPLYFAIKKGQFNTVKLLFTHNADFSIIDQNGCSLLQVATTCGHVEIVKFLIEKKANLEFKDIDGFTALHFAAEHNQTQIAEILLQAGANKEAKNIIGCTSLHIAVIKNSINTALFLVESKLKLDVVNNNFDTPLLLAAQHGRMEIIEILLKAGANKEAKNQGGNTCVHIAALKNHINILPLLFKFGANLDARNKTGDTALSLATWKGHFQVVKFLCKNGANLLAVNNNNNNILHQAAQHGRIAFIKFFIHLGIKNLNTRDCDGCTPLHFAVICKQKKETAFLIQNGANPNLQTLDCFTSLELAFRYHPNDLNFMFFLMSFLSLQDIQKHKSKNPEMIEIINVFNHELLKNQKRLYDLIGPCTMTTDHIFYPQGMPPELLAKQLELYFPEWYQYRLLKDIKAIFNTPYDLQEKQMNIKKSSCYLPSIAPAAIVKNSHAEPSNDIEMDFDFSKRRRSKSL